MSGSDVRDPWILYLAFHPGLGLNGRISSALDCHDVDSVLELSSVKQNGE